MDNIAWMQDNWFLLAIAAGIIVITIYLFIRQHRLNTKRQQPKKQPQSTALQPIPQAQSIVNKGKSKPASIQPVAKPASLGIGIYNGMPVLIWKESGKSNGWQVQDMKCKSYMQNSDDITFLVLSLAQKVREYEGTKNLLNASKEALQVLDSAQVEALDPIIQKLRASIDWVEESEALKGA